MKITSPADFSHVTPLARPVEKGETVDVDDTVGAQLAAQGWKPAGPGPKAKKPTVGDEGPETVAPPAAPTEEQ